ncbi:MAG: energy-coupling factor transporter ATPase [Acutalibacteraceae bacterium]|nr:energy-coupling factor transporter ATPase [Acutalibacteraceae bacterium]
MVLRTENLNYVYSEKTPFEKAAVKNINISIEENDFIGLIGHTGSGKSTLVQHFNGLMRPSSGTVYFEDKDIFDKNYNLNELRFKVGLVFQYPEYQLFDETVEKDISFGPRNMGLTENEIKERVDEAAQIVGLKSDLLSKSPFDLSGGEKRRAAIAGVIAMRPKVLILDEPTAGLDPLGRDLILDMLKNYRKEHNTTVILVSHSMEDIARVADKAIVMNKGEVFMYDTVENVFSQGEKLQKIGLNIPQVTKIFIELKQRGIDVPQNVFTLDKAEQILFKLFKKEGVQ